MKTTYFTFTERGVTYQVRKRKDGQVVYRDEAHLGGPWSLARLSIANTTLRLSFRLELQKAVKIVLKSS